MQGQQNINICSYYNFISMQIWVPVYDLMIIYLGYFLSRNNIFYIGLDN